MNYKVVYNDSLNLLGLLVSENYIRVYLQEDCRTFMPLTDSWEVIGEL
jgi:hypothetical protein